MSWGRFGKTVLRRLAFEAERRRSKAESLKPGEIDRADVVRLTSAAPVK
jgi:hypothetical protein